MAPDRAHPSRRVRTGGDHALVRPFLKSRGSLTRRGGRLGRKDGRGKADSVIAGVQCGVRLGCGVYRGILPDQVFLGVEVLAEVIAGANGLSGGCGSGLMLGLHRFGAVGFAVNMLNLLGNLGRDLAAGRLLWNLRRYLGAGVGAPLADLGEGVEGEFGELVWR